VATTATFTTAKVCLDDNAITATTKLLHYPGPVDVTDAPQYPDLTASPHRICSKPLTSLSPFVIARFGTPTPAGVNVSIAPPDARAGDSPVTVKFDRVTGAGLTTLIRSNSGPPLPNGFSVRGLPVYYHVETTAAFRSAAVTTLGTVAVGTSPHGVAFDGSSIWVANSSGKNVTKQRASDGATLGTFAVGNTPVSLAFDGSSIWVSNFLSNNVTKLRASDGAALGTFGVGSNPDGVAFDGSSIWVANQISNSITQLRASDGATLGTFATVNAAKGVAFDGSSIWVANNASNSATRLRTSDGTTLGTFAVGTSPIGVTFDGSSIWVTNFSSNDVTKLRASDGATLGTFAVGTQPVAAAFDGSNIWVTNSGSNNVTQLRASDGATLGTFNVDLRPQGAAFDGTNIWVAKAGSNNVSKLQASEGATVCIFDLALTSASRLLHYPPSTGGDVTAPGYPDLVNHVICSNPLPSLSPFVIAEADDTICLSAGTVAVSLPSGDGHGCGTSGTAGALVGLAAVLRRRRKKCEGEGS
jgi:outer membrane lipoprotein-sorting protein